MPDLFGSVLICAKACDIKSVCSRIICLSIVGVKTFFQLGSGPFLKKESTHLSRVALPFLPAWWRPLLPLLRARRFAPLNHIKRMRIASPLSGCSSVGCMQNFYTLCDLAGLSNRMPASSRFRFSTLLFCSLLWGIRSKSWKFLCDFGRYFWLFYYAFVWLIK